MIVAFQMVSEQYASQFDVCMNWWAWLGLLDLRNVRNVICTSEMENETMGAIRADRQARQQAGRQTFSLSLFIDWFIYLEFLSLGLSWNVLLLWPRHPQPICVLFAHNVNIPEPNHGFVLLDFDRNDATLNSPQHLESSLSIANSCARVCVYEMIKSKMEHNMFQFVFHGRWFLRLFFLFALMSAPICIKRECI